MTLPRIALSIVAAVASLSLPPALRADTHVKLAGFGIGVNTPGAGIGFWIGSAARAQHVDRAPSHREYVPSWRQRFIRIGPPPLVVVRPPVVVRPAPPIVIERPPVVIEKAPPVVENGTITVWITNSNGSQTSVHLTREGRWYVGPRGEYYDRMPTDEQLRLAYGF
jgi:hypothetical protein